MTPTRSIASTRPLAASRSGTAQNRALYGVAMTLTCACVATGVFACRPADAPVVRVPLDRSTAPAAETAPAPIAARSESTTSTTPAFPFRDPSLPLAQRIGDLVSRLTLQEKVAQMLHDTPAIERLGVPAYSWWNEALHGVARTGKATVFPQAIGMAATFDDELVHRVASAISDEARAKFNAAQKLGNSGRYAGLTFWSPNINIFRDPRWGRGQETYGEDPYLTSRMGVAFVRGLQGDDPKHLKTAACAKHYAVHSGPEGQRHEFDARPSRQDLYETYLPAFKALVEEAHVEGVMAAYNRVYGEPAAGSAFLLQQLLREQWGFQGYIVSDCWAVEDFHQHHKVTKTRAQSAAKALKAGVNLDCGESYTAIEQAVQDGLITEADIDAALSDLLRTRFRLGLFDPATRYDDLSDADVASEAHAALARSTAAKSFVLLRNDKHVLPLNKDIRSMMLIGPYVADSYVLLGNYYGSPTNTTTLLEGVLQKVNPGATVEFKYGFLEDRANDNPIDWTTADAQSTDAIVVTLGLSGLIEGEEGAAHASPFKGDRSELGLPPHQVQFLKTLRAAGNKPIIVVLFAGSPIALDEIRDLADAVLLAWYPGQEGGHALADVLFGDLSPSGRLPITFPRSTKQLPSYNDYSMENRGYRFMKAEPEYPFGFGLSYGSVSYESLQLSATELASPTSLTATVVVNNSSDRELEEVVQLYVSDVQASTRVPRAKLVGFRRVRLTPGETQSVAFEVAADALSLIDGDGKRVFEAGEFRFTAGGASPGPRAEALGSPKPVTAMLRLNGP